MITRGFAIKILISCTHKACSVSLLLVYRLLLSIINKTFSCHLLDLGISDEVFSEGLPRPEMKLSFMFTPVFSTQNDAQIYA